MDYKGAIILQDIELHSGVLNMLKSEKPVPISAVQLQSQAEDKPQLSFHFFKDNVPKNLNYN